MNCHTTEQGVSGMSGKHVVMDLWCDLRQRRNVMWPCFLTIEQCCSGAVPFIQLAASLSISVVLTKHFLKEHWSSNCMPGYPGIPQRALRLISGVEVVARGLGPGSLCPHPPNQSSSPSIFFIK